MSAGRITIDCPICDRKHQYMLKISRSETSYFSGFGVGSILMEFFLGIWRGLFKRSSGSKGSQLRSSASHSTNTEFKTFTRLFTCPVENTDFQATFRLPDPNDSIYSVDVTGME